ncbi:hypothetical protein [Nocardioides jejuensis]|uniref:Secreted protein n=1 Tax=Nocardioides jejuensis TaxID=2502782 RepID=A0A4R1CFR6_9ACTN|nr:hypothetical protein [Nocardioides jejuensis]TCJ30154.1 hypothetical protein EPD65_04505 [Nocardioides jejuensis]
MRKLLLLILACIAIVGVTSPASQAQTGDGVVNASDNHATDLYTNQCRGANLYSDVQGPGSYDQPGQVAIYLTNQYDPCVSRSRLKYVRDYNSGAAAYTGWHTLSGHSSTVYGEFSVIRCWTEVGLRRNDGSYYTRYQYNPSRPDRCNRHDVVHTRGSQNTVAATDQCDDATFTTYGTDSVTTTDTFNIGFRGLYDACVTRARLVYMRSGKRYTSAWTSRTGQAVRYTAGISGVKRCRTDVEIRRKNGTWFSVSQVPQYLPAGCGA